MPDLSSVVADPSSVLASLVDATRDQLGRGAGAKLVTGGVNKVVTGVQIQALSVVEAALDKTAEATRATAESVRGAGGDEAEELEVWTLDPKGDGFDDVRAVVAGKFGREKEWAVFSAYAAPRWEAVAGTTKTTARWTKVLAEELVSVAPTVDELKEFELPKLSQLKLPSGGSKPAKSKPKQKAKPKAAAQKPKAAPAAPFSFSFGAGAGKAAAPPKAAAQKPKAAPASPFSFSFGAGKAAAPPKGKASQAKEAPKPKGGWFGASAPKKAKETVAKKEKEPAPAKKKGPAWLSGVLPDL